MAAAAETTMASTTQTAISNCHRARKNAGRIGSVGPDTGISVIESPPGEAILAQELQPTARPKPSPAFYWPAPSQVLRGFPPESLAPVKAVFDSAVGGFGELAPTGLGFQPPCLFDNVHGHRAPTQR